MTDSSSGGMVRPFPSFAPMSQSWNAVSSIGTAGWPGAVGWYPQAPGLTDRYQQMAIRARLTSELFNQFSEHAVIVATSGVKLALDDGASREDLALRLTLVFRIIVHLIAG